MTNEEKTKRIAELEERAFLIKVGSDFLSAKDWEMLDKINEELKTLRGEKNAL